MEKKKYNHFYFKFFGDYNFLQIIRYHGQKEQE